MTLKTHDPDIKGSWPALRRAARRARKLAERTGTPLYVLKKGRVVDLNLACRRPSEKDKKSK